MPLVPRRRGCFNRTVESGPAGLVVEDETVNALNVGRPASVKKKSERREKGRKLGKEERAEVTAIGSDRTLANSTAPTTRCVASRPGIRGRPDSHGRAVTSRHVPADPDSTLSPTNHVAGRLRGAALRCGVSRGAAARRGRRGALCAAPAPQGRTKWAWRTTQRRGAARACRCQLSRGYRPKMWVRG